MTRLRHPGGGERKVRLVIVGTVALVSLPTWATEDCPFPISDDEHINAALSSAATCHAAAELFSACASGAGEDVARAALVQRRCEKDFLKGLSSASKRSYKAELARCWQQGRKNGSMYRAMAAGCAVSVAEDYSRRMKPR